MPPPFPPFADPETVAPAANQQQPPPATRAPGQPIKIESLVYFTVVNKMLPCSTSIVSSQDVGLSLEITLPVNAGAVGRQLAQLMSGSLTDSREPLGVLKVAGSDIFYISKSAVETVICCRPGGLKLVYWSQSARQTLQQTLLSFMQAQMREVARAWIQEQPDLLKEILKSNYWLSNANSVLARDHSISERLFDMKRAITALAHLLVDLLRHSGGQQGGPHYGSRVKEVVKTFKAMMMEYQRWLMHGMGGYDRYQFAIQWDDPVAWKPQLYPLPDPASFVYVSSRDKWYVYPRLTLEVDGERAWILRAENSLEEPPNIDADEDYEDEDAEDGGSRGALRITIPESRILYWRTMAIPAFREESSFELHLSGGEFYHFVHNRDPTMMYTFGVFRDSIRTEQIEDFRESAPVDGQQQPPPPPQLPSPITPFSWWELNKALNQAFHLPNGAYIMYGTFKRRNMGHNDPHETGEAAAAAQQNAQRYIEEAARLVSGDARRLVGRILDTLALNWVKAWSNPENQTIAENRIIEKDRNRYYRLRDQWHLMYQQAGGRGISGTNRPTADAIAELGLGDNSRDGRIKYDLARTNYGNFYEPI